MTYVGPGGSTAWGSNWQWPGASAPAPGSDGVPYGGFGGTGWADPADVATYTNPNFTVNPTPNGPPPAPGFDANLDPAYISGSKALDNSNQHAQDWHDYQTGYNAQSYGFDAQGNLISDPSNPNYNPYSQAQVLQHNYDNTKRGTVNSYASQGQLYSGALLNKKASDAYSFNLADDAAKRAAMNAGHTNDYSLTQTLDANGISLSGLMGNAWTNFLNQQQQG